jgi:hypothetical protein
MSYSTPSTTATTQVMFNSGTLDLGTISLAALQNVTVDISFAIEELRKLGSIKPVAHYRKGFKCSLKGKLKSINKELYQAYMGGSSSDGAGSLLSVTDGQAAAFNPTFTAIIDDNSSKKVQFQFTGAVITSMPLNANMETFGEVDFTMEALDVKLYVEIA